MVTDSAVPEKNGVILVVLISLWYILWSQIPLEVWCALHTELLMVLVDKKKVQINVTRILILLQNNCFQF